MGRRPRTQGFNLECLDLKMNGAAVAIDERCQTSMRNVWAIGDVAGEPMLAHRAMAQGEMVAEIIAGKSRRFEPSAIAAVCFTDPEVVVVGKTPEQASQQGLDCIVAQFPFAANGRAMTLESKSGFVRVVARRDNHLILGWQAVGVAVSELSTAFAQSWKWVPAWKTSPAPSTPTRPWARQSRKRHCGPWATHCISDTEAATADLALRPRRGGHLSSFPGFRRCL